METVGKTYEIIDANSKIHFSGHAGVLNECFGLGINKYGHQQGLWVPEGEKNWIVWFPKILKDKKGYPKAGSSGWINSISVDGMTINERLVDKNKVDYLTEGGYPNDLLRLVFAYDSDSGDYIFRGVFVGNNLATKERSHIFTRIATKVRLLGNPVHDIEILDEDYSYLEMPHKFEKPNGVETDIIEPLDSSHSQEEQETQAALMDSDSLRVAAEKHCTKTPIEKEVMITQYRRDAYIAEYAKQRANGICQLCGKEAPFHDLKGRPYLESHHIIWISKGGEDSIQNTVALCPNCHKKMHIVASQEEIDYLIKVAKEK